jgi:hypothetical protein
MRNIEDNKKTVIDFYDLMFNQAGQPKLSSGVLEMCTFITIQA